LIDTLLFARRAKEYAIANPSTDYAHLNIFPLPPHGDFFTGYI
jgi:hypothetical protein